MEINMFFRRCCDRVNILLGNFLHSHVSRISTNPEEKRQSRSKAWPHRVIKQDMKQTINSAGRLSYRLPVQQFSHWVDWMLELMHHANWMSSLDVVLIILTAKVTEWRQKPGTGYEDLRQLGWNHLGKWELVNWCRQWELRESWSTEIHSNSTTERLLQAKPLIISTSIFFCVAFFHVAHSMWDITVSWWCPHVCQDVYHTCVRSHDRCFTSWQHITEASFVHSSALYFFLQNHRCVKFVCFTCITSTFLQHVLFHVMTQHRREDVMLAVTPVQTTDASSVNMCTNCGMSRSHFMLISHLLYQQVEGMVVALLQTNKGILRHLWDISSSFCATKPGVLLSRPVEIENATETYVNLGHKKHSVLSCCFAETHLANIYSGD